MIEFLTIGLVSNLVGYFVGSHLASKKAYRISTEKMIVLGEVINRLREHNEETIDKHNKLVTEYNDMRSYLIEVVGASNELIDKYNAVLEENSGLHKEVSELTDAYCERDTEAKQH